MKLHAFALLAAAAAPQLARAAAGGATPKVAVVVSLEPDSVNVPTVELYRAVVDAVGQSSAFHAGGSREVKDRIRAPAKLKSLGSIPAFERAAFLAAKPDAKKSKRKKKRGGVIPPLQVMLDTLALDGAIIVDCAPKGEAAVNACGLYYYDRALGRVLAASSKGFKVEISDASLWAPGLVSGLSQGLDAHANGAERERLNQVLAEKGDDEAAMNMGVELRLSGKNLGEPRGQVTSIPGAALLVGPQGNGYASGLELGMAQAGAGSRLGEVSVTQRAAGLFFATQSRALDALLWDLDLGVGYAVTQATIAGDRNGKLTARGVKLRVSPGVLWEVNHALQFGASVSYERLESFAGASSGLYAGDAFAKNVLGFGIRLRTVL